MGFLSVQATALLEQKVIPGVTMAAVIGATKNAPKVERKCIKG